MTNPSKRAILKTLHIFAPFIFFISKTSLSTSNLSIYYQIVFSFAIGINSTYNMVRREDFPKIKLGRKILIFKEELPAWFDLHKGEDLAY